MGAGRLKFYGWGMEGAGLDEAERERLFSFVSRLGIEPHVAAPPRVTDIALRAPRLQPPPRGSKANLHRRTLTSVSCDSYGKSFPEARARSSRATSGTPPIWLP